MKSEFTEEQIAECLRPSACAQVLAPRCLRRVLEFGQSGGASITAALFTIERHWGTLAPQERSNSVPESLKRTAIKADTRTESPNIRGAMTVERSLCPALRFLRGTYLSADHTSAFACTKTSTPKMSQKHAP
jgi:hypothetical protein